MNILVTGASRGIGYHTAKSLVSKSNHKVLAISRNGQGLNALRAECEAMGLEGCIHPLPFDLQSSEPYEKELLPSVAGIFGTIDILINNAGLLVNKPYININDADIHRMLAVNFIAAARLIRVLLPLIKPSGHVVNISSMGGYQGSVKFPGLSVYSASKAALACLTECLAEEFKGKGPSFNCLAVGAVDTEMLREAFPGYEAPLSAEGMGAFVADFALNGNNYFNGKVLPVSASTP